MTKCHGKFLVATTTFFLDKRSLHNSHGDRSADSLHAHAKRIWLPPDSFFLCHSHRTCPPDSPTNHKGCRIKRRIKSCAGAASSFKIALKSRDSHRSFLSLRREPLIQNSPSALMTGRLGHVGLSGCRSCSPHSLLRSVRIRFIRAAYSKQFFRGSPHPSGPDP